MARALKGTQHTVGKDEGEREQRGAGRGEVEARKREHSLQEASKGQPPQQEPIAPPTQQDATSEHGLAALDQRLDAVGVGHALVNNDYGILQGGFAVVTLAECLRTRRRAPPPGMR